MHLIECKRANECVSEWERRFFSLSQKRDWVSHTTQIIIHDHSFIFRAFFGYQPELKRYSLSEYIFFFYFTEAVLVVTIIIIIVVIVGVCFFG